jgi:hypothetical protein
VKTVSNLSPRLVSSAPEPLTVSRARAYVAAGPRTYDARTTIVDPTTSREYLEEQRPKQLSKGVILMIIGAVLIVLGVVVGL